MNRFLVFSLMMMVTLNAIEIDPGAKKVPEQFYNSKGGFSIFTGDPERIQKTNKIDFKDFEAKVSLQPATLSLGSPGAVIKVDFSVRNIGKKTYVLSYPDAQRYDVWIKNAAGQVVYKWSADKLFVQEVGTSLLNANDRIAFLPQVNISDFDLPAQPGVYTVEVVLANYPDVKGTTMLTLTP
jgi:hypothetical protein